MRDLYYTCPKVDASFDGNILRVKILEGICLNKSSCGFGLYATKFFKKGEALYLNYYNIIEDVEREFNLIVNNIIYKLHTKTHTYITKNNKRALYNFDAWFNHSCEPNTYSFSTTEITP